MKNKNFQKLLIVALSASIFACSSGHKPSAKKESQTRAEKVTIVERMQPEKIIVLPAELVAWEKTTIYPKVESFVKDIYVDRGSVVKKGQLLAVLEAPELRSEYAKEEAKLRENEANYLASKANYKRLHETSKTPGAVSPNELDMALSRMLADSSNVVSSKASLASVAEMINYLRITAPFDGIITERNVHPGALVGTRDKDTKDIQPMLIIEHNDKLRLTAAIPEVYAAEMEDNCGVNFTVAAYPERLFSGVLRRNSQCVKENIRSMFVEFDVENKNHVLKPGMYADIQFPIKRPAPTLFVPISAVVNSMEKVFVIRVNNNKAEWVDVKKGNIIGDKIEIFSDKIQEGDKVVVKASEEIRNEEPLMAKG